MQKGIMIISLDFELLWGLTEIRNDKDVQDAVLGGRTAVEHLLNLFAKYDIHATWGVVGALLAQSKQDLIAYFPKERPTYADTTLSNYNYLDEVGENEQQDPFHYAHSLIEKIRSTKNQEVGSHTFIHYNCSAPGQTVEQFEGDLNSATIIFQDKFPQRPTSMIFPKNQYRPEHIEAIKQYGFTAFRGTPSHYAYDHSDLLARALRLLDSYTGVLGKKCYDEQHLFDSGICNVKASAFFRKYNKSLSFLEWMKIRTIKKQMLYAAKNKKMFHLWWHPHNFGLNTGINLEQMEDILKYYKFLDEKFGFESKNMSEVAHEYK